MIEIKEGSPFLQDNEGKLFYVGFFKTGDTWSPLCMVSDPDEKKHLDTLYLSPSLESMSMILGAYKEKVQKFDQTFVQFLTVPEIRNIMERYALGNVAYIGAEQGTDGGCGCGCGCGCG